MHVTSPPNRDLQRAFGTFRLLFAVTVIFHHAFYLSGATEGNEGLFARAGAWAGPMAVQGFFALSGILVMRSILRVGSAGAFLWHRVLRVVPGLWVSLAVVSFGILPLAAAIEHQGFTWMSVANYGAKNAVLPGSVAIVPPIFVTVPQALWVNGSLWTLRWEMLCYLLLALAGATGMVLRRPSSIGWIALAMYGSRVGEATYRNLTGDGIWQIYRGDYSVVLVFFVAAYWTTLSEDWRRKLSSNAVAFLLLAVMGLAMGWNRSHWITPLALPPLLTAGNRLWRGPYLDEWVRGDYSYGLYVYSYPIQQFLAVLGLSSLGGWRFFALSLFATLPIAIGSWHWIEKPCLRLKSWRPDWIRFAKTAQAA